MNKRFYSVLLLLIFGSVMVGCEDYLDQQPNSTFAIDEFYSTPKEAEIALAGMYGILATDAVYGRDLSIIMDSGTDESYYNRRYNENWTVGLYRETAADNYVKEFWSALYEVINLSNLFEENLKKDGFTEQEYNRFLGESRFLRAQSYFLLVSWFNEVPMPLKPTEDQTANKLAPSTLPEIYGQIIKDFKFAGANLPKVGDSNYVPGRAGSMAAHGLLARVYLKMAGNPLNDTDKYADAKKEAGIVINDGTHGLNTTNGNGYREHFLNYIQNHYDTKESLFEISFAYLRDMDVVVDGRIGGLNGVPFNFGGGQNGYPGAYAQMNASPLLKSLYTDDDLRKDWNLPGFQYTKTAQVKPVTSLQVGYAPGKYRRWEPVNFDDINQDPPTGETEGYKLLENVISPNKNFTSINFPVLRYSDVLLMHAEAINAINGGPNAEAINDVNEVRERAGLQDIQTAKPSAIANGESFFKYLVNERMRELAFEGLRKMDLIRWGLLGERLELSANIIKGEPGYKKSDPNAQAFLRPSQFFDPAKNLSLPYPLQEVRINEALDQKPGW